MTKKINIEQLLMKQNTTDTTDTRAHIHGIVITNDKTAVIGTQNVFEIRQIFDCLSAIFLQLVHCLPVYFFFSRLLVCLFVCSRLTPTPLTYSPTTHTHNRVLSFYLYYIFGLFLFLSSILNFNRNDPYFPCAQ